VVGMRDPQSEVAVELHGLGAPRDVTHSHMLACAAPFTVGIGFDGPVDLESLRERQLWLRFRQRAGEQRLLGALRLRPSATIPVNGQDVCCFAVRSSRNQCLPRMRLWARYLHWAYLR